MLVIEFLYMSKSCYCYGQFFASWVNRIDNRPEEDGPENRRM